MPCPNAYVMCDQVRDQIPSIMGEDGPHSGANQLAAHLFATGLVALFYILMIAVSR